MTKKKVKPKHKVKLTKISKKEIEANRCKQYKYAL